MKRFSKLQQKVYNLFDDKLKGRLQFHETVYGYPSYCSGCAIRFDLDGELLYNWPHDINNQPFYKNKQNTSYFYFEDISDLNSTIDEYINCPKDELFSRNIDDFGTGLIDILRAADRRIGKRQKNNFLITFINDEFRANAVMKILKLRGFITDEDL